MNTDSPSVIQAKALFRAVLQAEMGEALSELHARHPRLRVEQLMELLKREHPELVRAAQRAEDDEWGVSVKPELPDAVTELVERINRPQKIQAYGRDSEAFLVQAARRARAVAH